MVEALEEAVVLTLEMVGFLAASAAVVEVEATVLDWMVQVAAAMEVAWAEVMGAAQEDAVAPVAVMAPVVALMELAPEVW